jgi:ferredoxin-fold anticodon binding domain-containing protein
MIWLVFPLRNIISILGLSTSCIELSINDLYWGTSVEPQRAKITMEEYVWILQLSNKELKIEVLKASQFLKRAEIK